MQPAAAVQPTISLRTLQHLLTHLEKLPTVNNECLKNYKPQEISSILDRTELLWKNGVVIDSSGDTLLHWASKNGHWMVCADLIKREENCNRKNFAGLTPIELVQGISEELTMKIFNISKENLKITAIKSINCLPPLDQSKNRTLWNELMRINDPDILSEKIKMQPLELKEEFMNLRFPHGGSILHEALSQGRMQLFNLCVSLGLAEHNAKDNEGNTAAHLLVIRCDNSYSPILLECINIRNHQGKSLLHLLAAHNRIRILGNISNFRNHLHSEPDLKGNCYYHDAAKNGSLEFLKTVWNITTGQNAKSLEKLQHDMGLKNFKADYVKYSHFDKTNFEGKNILHIAAEAKQIITLMYLLTLPDMIPLLDAKDLARKKPLEYLPEIKFKIPGL